MATTGRVLPHAGAGRGSLRARAPTLQARTQGRTARLMCNLGQGTVRHPSRPSPGRAALPGAFCAPVSRCVLVMGFQSPAGRNAHTAQHSAPGGDPMRPQGGAPGWHTHSLAQLPGTRKKTAPLKGGCFYFA